MNSTSAHHRVNGLKLFVHRFRDAEVRPSGLTILLVHGFLDAGATWQRIATELATDGHEVIAPDLRGFGQSDPIGAGGYYHFPDYIADLAELVELLAPMRLGVVGHSMGGTISALFTGTFPDKVERLALLEGMGPVSTDPPFAVDRMQAWLRDLRRVDRTPRVLSSMREAVERLALHHPRVAREIIEEKAKVLTKHDDQGRLVWAYDPLHRTTSPTPFNVVAFKEFLARIECPTLIVSGGVTGWHPPDEAERVACVKRTVRYELPDAGHMMHWTEPEKVARRLSAFFAEPPQSLRVPTTAVSPPTRPSSPLSVGSSIPPDDDGVSGPS